MTNEKEIKSLGTWWYVPNIPSLETYREIKVIGWDSRGDATGDDLMLYPRRLLYVTEKDAIIAARKMRVTEIDRLQEEVNALDARVATIEEAEVKAGVV